MPVGSELPLGLQMTADLGQDSRLIRAAIQLQARFKTGPNISPA
jgi:Asp-tRNA(Asn)/Glu-tRNA(Gln) amidotransferase A subunit family amidase